MEPGNANRDFGIRARNWWNGVPLFSKFILVVTVSTCIYFFYPIVFLYFELCYHPSYAFSGLKFWQFFTFPYVSLGPFTAIFSLCSYIPLSSKREKALGTLRFFLYFVLKNFMIALIYTPLFYIVYAAEYPENYFFIYYFSFYLSGLFPATMVELILVYNENIDDLSNFLIFPIQLKRKYHPWVFFLICLIIFGAFLKLIAGVIVGYLCNSYSDLYGHMKWSEVSSSAAKEWEEKLCKNLTSSSSFVQANESGSEMPEIIPNSMSSAQILIPQGSYVPLPSEPSSSFDDEYLHHPELEILDEDKYPEESKHHQSTS